MKKINITKRKLIIIIIAMIIIISIMGVIIGNLVRKNNINKQALGNINEEEKITTIFCNGHNIVLKNNIYNKLKNEGYDITIYNDSYVARIGNEQLSNKINLNINVSDYKELNNTQAYMIDLNGTFFKSLYIKNNIEGKSYLSEYSLDDEIQFINNDSKVNENGYVNIELKDNIYKYVCAYVIPEEINVEDIEMNKGASKKIELGIEKDNYTLGSVEVICNDEEAIEIDSEYKIKGNKVGEYTLTYKTDKYVKEANLKILQSVEKIELNKTTLDMVVDGTNKIDAIITPDDAVNKDLNWASSNEEIVAVDNDGNLKAKKVGNCEITVSTTSEPIVEAKAIVEVSDKPSLSTLLTAPAIGQIQGATYINGILLVNKTHSIPASYAPGLNSQAYQAYQQLKNDAASAGYDMPLLSGYRSYETQDRLYNNYVATYGQAEADTFSAKPGTSEHQTGLAMDVGQIEDWYGDTAAGKWLAQNCYKYGFIIRYPKGKESITGYKYEPWHIRYLGVDIATQVYNSGLTLEEFLGAI